MRTKNKIDLLEVGQLALGGTRITADADELNILDGVTSTAAELNALDGITSSVAELNKLTGVTKTAAQLNLLVAGVAGSYKVARGETALDGTNPTPVATGLATVVAFTATLKGTGAPGVGTSVLTQDIAGAAGNVNVYAWKPTGSSDPTLVASTGTETFGWIAVGT